MSNSSNKPLRDIARQDEEFPGLLAALKPVLLGLVPDDQNYSGDSYDELFVVLAAALYLTHDPVLRKRNADRNGGSPKLVSVMLNEGPKDKDALLVGKVLDRLAPYVHPADFLDSLSRMHASTETIFREYRSALERLAADVWRITIGFEPGPKCPDVLRIWAGGPNLPLLRKILVPA
jgi:hypothetical protein